MIRDREDSSTLPLESVRGTAEEILLSDLAEARKERVTASKPKL